MWVRIDDAAPLHPKMLKAGPAALALWLCGLAHCNRHSTDGKIDKTALTALYPSTEWALREMKRAADKLVTLGLWIDRGQNWVVHDYAEYQSEAMSQAVKRRREQARDRKRSQRDRERDGQRDARDVSQRDAQKMRSTYGRDSGEVASTCSQDTAEMAKLGPSNSNGLGPMSRIPGSHDPVPSRPVDLSPHGDRSPLPTPSALDPERLMSEPASRSPVALARAAIEQRYLAVTASPPSWSTKNLQHLRTLAEWLTPREASDRERVLQRALDGFFSDPWVQEHGYPLGALASEPGKYLQPRLRNVTRGFVPPAPAADFKPTDPDSVFGK